MSDTAQELDQEWLRRRVAAAVALTTLTDLESTLQETVRVARSLMDADMAYVSFTDFDANETVIRKSDGVRTRAYANLRQPLGSGVLGRVAIGHSSYWSADYEADATIHRTVNIDRVVHSEGVRAILATPLSVSGRVIGSLAIAERTSQRFPALQVQRLESIAAQAAVAIDNAMRYDDTAALLEKLTDEHRRDAEERALDARGLELDRRLMEAVTAGLGLDALVSLGADTLGVDLWFEPLLSRRVVGSADLPAPDRSSASFETIFVGGERIGYLLASRALTEPETELLERAGAYLALGVMLSRARQDVDLRDSSDVLSELVDGTVRQEDLAALLESAGLGHRDRLCCLVLTRPEGIGAPVLRALHADAPEPILATVLDEERLCVLTGDPVWIEQLPRLFRSQSWKLRAGMSWTDATAAGIAAARRRAELALSAMISQDLVGLSDGSSLGLLAALLDLAQRGDLPEGLTESLEPLIAHDEEHGTELMATARVYFDADESAARAADLLGVHRNTIRKRLARISQLIGDDWLRSPRKLDVHLALRAHAALPR